MFSAVNSRRSVVESTVDRTRHVGRVAAAGAVNTRPLAVAVYIALADGRCAVAKLSESRVWNKVPEESALVFGDNPSFPKTQRYSVGRGKHVMRKLARYI